MKRVHATRATREFDDTVYVTTMAQCSLWVIYAMVTPGRLQPLVTNICGTVAAISYVGVFFWYHEKRKRWLLLGKLSLAILVVSAVVVIAILVNQYHGRSDAELFLGLVCDIVNVIMYGAPFLVLRLVIRTRSVEFMPLGITLGTFAAGLMWSCYAFWVGDIWVGLPNHAGVVFGLVQLSLYAKYCGQDTNAPIRNARLLQTGDAITGTGHNDTAERTPKDSAPPSV